MNLLKKIAAAALLAVLCAVPSCARGETPAAELEAERFFAARDWKSLDALAASGEKLTPRVLSLAANSLWYRSRWADALALMERVGADYPPSVRLYARLLMALALERTNQPKKAYDAALALYRDADAAKNRIARYYSMYILERLTKNVDEKEKWLRRMAASEDNRSRRAAVMTELAKIDRLKPADALEILRADPQNAAALKIAADAPDSPQKNYRLGYAAYLRGDNKTAVSYLSRLKFDAPYGESGTYYLGLALQRLDRSPEAAPLMIRLVYKKGSDHIQRAIGRLRVMIGGRANDAALTALQKMTGDKNPVIASTALYSLAQSSWSKSGEARELFLRRYPEGTRANTLRWSRGWKKFLAGDLSGALSSWTAESGSSAQLLYWRARIYKKQGRDDEAEKLTDELLNSHPLTVYSFLARENGSLEVTDDPVPGQMRAAPPDELERWGFMTHARMLLEGKKDLPSRVRRANLAAWLGQDWHIYRDLHGAIEPLMTGTKIPRAMLEIVYPRPFRPLVEAAAKKYGVDPLIVWSIMKQESGFNPSVSSWVGAAGLMQLMPATAAGEAKIIGMKKYSLYSPADNIEMGTSHISRLLKRYGTLDRAAAAYNAGSGSVNKWNRARDTWEDDAWMESIPFRETNGYVKNVLRNYAVYRKLYGASGAAASEPQPAPGEDPELQTPEVPGEDDA